MIKANVKYTGDHMWACHKEYSRFDWKFVTDIILYSALLVMSVGIFCYLLPFFGKSEWITKYTFIYAFLCLFCLFIAFSTIRKKFKRKKEISSNVPNQFENNFSFDENEFFHEYASDEEWGFRRCGYDALLSAKETKLFFLVRIDKTKVCVIGKHEITQGTSEELSALLAEKLGKKFRRKCR